MDDQETLKEKALQLLRSERELFALQARHEQTVSWLRIIQSLPELVDRRLPEHELYTRIAKALTKGLRIQRASFFRYREGELRLITGRGEPIPVSLNPEARALVEGTPGALYNEPTDEATQALASAVGLHRFLFTRIHFGEGDDLLLVAGYDRDRAEFQAPFDEGHVNQLASLGQHLEILLRNTKLVNELERDKERLQRFNETLEHKVEERTAELAHKNRDMRLVLDNVDQGFMTLSPDGRMAAERSRIVDEWFGSCSGMRTLWEYLGAASETFALHFQLAWEQLVEGSLPLELALSQLPSRLTTAEKTFSFRYSPLLRDESFEGILLIASDITSELAREREEAEQQEITQAFRQLMLDRIGFKDFLRETSVMIDGIKDTSRRDRRSFLRTIHTLKGNAATLGLTRMAAICHALEEGMTDAGEEPDEHLLTELDHRWSVLTGHVGNLVGFGNQRIIEVPERDYSALVSKLAERAKADDLALDQLLSWRLEPLSRPLERLAEHATALASRKGFEVDVRVESRGLRIDPERWRPLFNELTHIARNAVAHGFESAEERQVRSKSARNQMWLSADIERGLLKLEIGDDGRGMNWEALRRKARQRGLPAETHDELVQAVFQDGVSTRDEADETSGRGVGMAVVRARVESMRGRIEVRSKPGAGTTWVIEVPILHPNDVRRPEELAGDAPQSARGSF